MAKHGIKITDEILDFNTVEDFALIRSEYKQRQRVRFYCTKCNEPVIRNVERIQALITHNQFTHLCGVCQRKATSQKLYGCDSPSQTQQAKEKSKQTRLKKFGGWNSDKQREAIAKTFKERKDEIYEIGEVSQANCRNAYPLAMAYKRCFDRVVLKKSKLA